MRKLSVVALLLAGCGGGSDEPPVVSNSPPAVAATPGSTPAPVPPNSGTSPTPVAQTPAPAPAVPAPAAPAPATPSPVTPPPKAPPAPVASPPPAATPSPAPATPTDTVAGLWVWAALQREISKDPAPGNPYSDDRRVSMADGSYYFLGGAMSSYSFARAPWGAIMADNEVSVKAIGSDGIIRSVEANGMTLNGGAVDLRNINPQLNTSVGSWSNGEWYASLVIQPDDRGVRVCWNVHLPPPAPVYGPPGVEPAKREPVFKRLMCGIYSKTGEDVGGHVIDDFAGTIRTFRGSW